MGQPAPASSTTYMTHVRALFAADLKKAMAAKGLSQASLARRAHLGSEVIARYAAARYLPNDETLGLLAQALEIPPTALMPAAGGYDAWKASQ